MTTSQDKPCDGIHLENGSVVGLETPGAALGKRRCRDRTELAIHDSGGEKPAEMKEFV